MTDATTRLPGLDGIRAVAVLLVIFHHLCSNGTFADWPAVAHALKQGIFGVQIFFVLSGFLITWLLLNEEARTGSIDLRRFYRRRAFRILPPAFAYLSVITLLAAAGVLVVGRADLLSSWFFVRNLYTSGTSPAVAHFWSLAIEEQFYLTWPFALVLLEPGRRAGAVAAAVLVLVLWRASGVGHFGQTVAGGEALLVGCLLALVRHRAGGVWPTTSRVAAAVVVPVSLVVIALIEFGSDDLRAIDGLRSVSLVAVAAIINAAVERRPHLLDIALEASALQRTGRLSYSLYLWQQPFCWGPLALAFAPSAWPALVAASFACAAAGYYLIEQPALAWRDRARQG